MVENGIPRERLLPGDFSMGRSRRLWSTVSAKGLFTVSVCGFSLPMVQIVGHCLIAHLLNHPQSAYQQNPGRRDHAVSCQQNQNDHHHGKHHTHHPEREVAALADLLLLRLVTAFKPVLLKSGVKHIAPLFRMNGLGGPDDNGLEGGDPHQLHPETPEAAGPLSCRLPGAHGFPATWHGPPPSWPEC